MTTAFLHFFFDSKIIWLKDNEQFCVVPTWHKMQNKSQVNLGEECRIQEKEMLFFKIKQIVKINKRERTHTSILFKVEIVIRQFDT